MKDGLFKKGWQTNILSSSMSIEKEVLCAAQRHQQHEILGCNGHCWKILLILVLGKVASKTQYSHFVICKVWVLGFTHHFTLHPLIWQIFSLISWLYFSTMWILWGRKCDYWVFHITHAKKGLPNHSSSTRDLKDFFSICDVENTILTFPPHSILSLPWILRHYCE